MDDYLWISTSLKDALWILIIQSRVTFAVVHPSQFISLFLLFDLMRRKDGRSFILHYIHRLSCVLGWRRWWHVKRDVDPKNIWWCDFCSDVTMMHLLLFSLWSRFASGMFRSLLPSFLLTDSVFFIEGNRITLKSFNLLLSRRRREWLSRVKHNLSSSFTVKNGTFFDFSKTAVTWKEENLLLFLKESFLALSLAKKKRERTFLFDRIASCRSGAGSFTKSNLHAIMSGELKHSTLKRKTEANLKLSESNSIMFHCWLMPLMGIIFLCFSDLCVDLKRLHFMIGIIWFTCNVIDTERDVAFQSEDSCIDVLEHHDDVNE